uniref:Uncharacterized protein n=1 Tax=Brassica oleracea var. oleracea TaxID=109376 RepID=A0A0D3CDK5_BRAOL
MPVLLRSSQSALQEEVVEEMKDCRSITQHWCRSTVMPERGYMPISTRSSKEELLFFSDQTRLECSIRKEKRTSSIDTTSTTSINTTSTTSIDTLDRATIDTSNDSQSSESIDTKPSASVDTLRLSEQPETEKSKSEGRTKNRKKKKKRNVDADFLPLVPLQCQEGSLEYRVRCRGGSEPFTKVRVLCDPELREKGEVSARSFIYCINKMKKRDTETCSGASKKKKFEEDEFARG